MAQSAILTEELLTGRDLWQMGDIGSCELIDGRIVSMSPTGGEHGRIENRLGFELMAFIREKPLGWVLVGEVGIYIRRNPDTVRGADVVFLSKERAPDGPSTGFLEIAPDVVVEIISPSDRWQDLRQKIEDYFTIGVEQVWVVEPDAQKLLVFDAPTRMRAFAATDFFEADGALKGFSLKISELFGM